MENVGQNVFLLMQGLLLPLLKLVTNRKEFRRVSLVKALQKSNIKLNIKLINQMYCIYLLGLGLFYWFQCYEVDIYMTTKFLMCVCISHIIVNINTELFIK